MVTLLNLWPRKAAQAEPAISEEMPRIKRDFQANADQVSQRIDLAFSLFVNEGVRAHGGEISPVSFDKRRETLFVEMKGACDGCTLAQRTLQDGILTVMKQHAPQVKAVRACIPI